MKDNVFIISEILLYGFLCILVNTGYTPFF